MKISFVLLPFVAPAAIKKRRDDGEFGNGGGKENDSGIERFWNPFIGLGGGIPIIRVFPFGQIAV